MSKKPARKKPPLTLHNDGACGCSKDSNPNECIYQVFLDGWDFTADVGNGKKRGEIFTPRFIVDKMITDVGIFPAAGLYDQDYTTVSAEEASEIVHKRVVEPAVGTANFTATVLWHKLQYAYTASCDANGELDIQSYHQHVLTAVASIYAFDIDVGNVEVTRRRLLENSTPITDESVQAAWITELTAALAEDSRNSEVITATVQESLEIAAEHWSKFLNMKHGGVIQQLYTRHTGQQLPEDLYAHCAKILQQNMKLFNGIEQEDTVVEATDEASAFTCPGWDNVYWDWWNINVDAQGDITVDSTKVSMALQILTGSIEQLEIQAARLKEERCVLNEDEGLFATTEWITPKDRQQYNKLMKDIAKLEEQVAARSAAEHETVTV